jgi:alkylation response protein AidB-like acyl-CoA dehydrogenase
LSTVSTRPNLALSGEHDDLRGTVRQFLAATSAPAIVRQVMESEDGFDRSTWSQMAEQLGLQALLVPERYEGLGQGAVEAQIVFEEMGRALYPGPYFASAGLATNALLCSGDQGACEALLPGIAAGATIATVAVTEVDGRWDRGSAHTRAKRNRDGWVVDGAKSFVPNGQVADLFLVTAQTDAGLSLFAVDSADPGVEPRALESLDLTRRLAGVTFAGAGARLVGEDGGAPAVIAATLDRALVALAAEEAGGAARCLEMSVEYAKQREQFGRSIGSFQAIAHRCVEMLQRVEFSRAASRYAASCLAAESSEYPVAVRVAAAYCGRAYRWVATENIQVHGGIGFTWEHEAHLHYRRSWASETLLGGTDQHYLAVADRLGL